MSQTALAFPIYTAVNAVEFHLKSTWNSTINVKEIYKYSIKHNSTIIRSTQLSDFPVWVYLHTKIVLVSFLMYFRSCENLAGTSRWA